MINSKTSEKEIFMDTTISRRNFIKTGSLALLGAAIAANTGTNVFANPSPTPFKPIRFAVISDPHVDIKGENKMKMSAYSVDCLQQTVAELNKEEDLAFVMANGDLLQDGERENAKVVRDALKSLKAPSFVVSGNHDYEPAKPEKRRPGFSYMTTDEFVQYFAGHGYDNSGSHYYAKEIVPGLRLLTLDACVPLEKRWGGNLPEEQLQWLDEELSSHAGEVHLVFMHHNFIPWTVDELRGGPKKWFCVDNAPDVRAVLEKNISSTPIAISGHRHIGLHHRMLNKVNYFVAPSLNSHPMRYSVFTITPEQISWKTPMVPISEIKHLEAREALLNATWWRDEQYKERTAHNDTRVLGLYENNNMLLGARQLMEKNEKIA